jgi:hypothetical protein
VLKVFDEMSQRENSKISKTLCNRKMELLCNRKSTDYRKKKKTKKRKENELQQNKKENKFLRSHMK